MRRVPFTRLGLLVIVGTVFASIINFYIGVGLQLADFGADDLATEPRDLFDHFVNNFLFGGAVLGLLFWLGIGLCVAGIVRNLFFPLKYRHH